MQRDLKPQNLLLMDTSATPVVKIADFGFARNLQPQGLADTLCGSPLYMAPEILQFHKYDAKVPLAAAPHFSCLDHPLDNRHCLFHCLLIGCSGSVVNISMHSVLLVFSAGGPVECGDHPV